MSTRVLIADDHALVRAGFHALIAAEPGFSVAGEASTGRQAVELAQRTHPDIVLIDIRMPEMDGIEATRQIVGSAAALTTTRVLILTTFDLDEYVYAALRAGASGFLTKDTPPAGLIAAIRVISAGDALLSPQITRRLIETFLNAAEIVPAAGLPGEALAAITEREREVLALVGHGLSNAEIGRQLRISPNTIRTHVGHLLTKLDARDRVHLVVLAYKTGLITVALTGRPPQWRALESGRAGTDLSGRWRNICSPHRGFPRPGVADQGHRDLDRAKRLLILEGVIMTAGTQTDPDFAFTGLATPEATEAIKALVGGPDPLGALAGLLGTWKGHGFNAIWRPHHPASPQDRFLELNKTDETLVFTRINGPIPNRGLAMADINMFGLTYMQQISESSTGAGLHIEPGIWAAVPATTDPGEPASVVRMASIPHGTVILAQGVAQVIQGGPQHIPDNNILPFFFGNPAPANADFNSVAQTFTELNLSQPTQFRFVAPGVTQNIVKNPNSVLQDALQSSLQGTTMKSRTFLHVATDHSTIKAGGGTANTAFLATSGNPPGGNAVATRAEATFWIETIAGTGGQPDRHQLQYTQLVMLDFNGIHWPHVTVGTLVKQ